MVDKELMPCPFCGGAVNIYNARDVAAWNGKWTIECHECLIEMCAPYTFDPTIQNVSIGYAEMLQEHDALIKRWNKRWSMTLSTTGA